MSHPHSVQTGFSSLLPIFFQFHRPFLGFPLPPKFVPLATSLRYSRTAVLNLDMERDGPTEVLVGLMLSSESEKYSLTNDCEVA